MISASEVMMKINRVYYGVPFAYYERVEDISIFRLFGFNIYERIGEHIAVFGLMMK